MRSCYPHPRRRDTITKPSSKLPQHATSETSAPPGHPSTLQSSPSPEPVGFSQGQKLYAPENPKTSRYHPYPPAAERSAQVSLSSFIYGQLLNQPTPYPLPKQYDEYEYVYDPAHLSEFLPTPKGAHYQYPQYSYKNYGNIAPDMKALTKEREDFTDIVDLKSQKVEYGEEEEEDENELFDEKVLQMHHNGHNQLPWSEQKMFPHHQKDNDPKMFPKYHIKILEQKEFTEDDKMFPHHQKDIDPKMFPKYHIKVLEQKEFTQDEKMHSHKLQLYPQDQKILPDPQHETNAIHQVQNVYQPHQMSVGEYQCKVSESSEEIQEPYRPSDSATDPLVSNTEASDSSKSAPPISEKGSKKKSAVVRRRLTYHCKICDRWYTSTGHINRHFTTEEHKFAVRYSGKPDPAIEPIENHYHPYHFYPKSNSSDSNTQSPLLSDDPHSPDDSHDAYEFPAQSFDRSQDSGMGPFVNNSDTYQQLNTGNNIHSYNPLLYNHPITHQMVTHLLAMGNPSAGLGNPLDTGHHSQSIQPPYRSSFVSNFIGNSPNGQAGPSAQSIHHSRGLQSISTSSTGQPIAQVMAHNLSPLNYLLGNPYSPMASAQVHTQLPTPTGIYLGQNFQQTSGQNYPNAMSPHIMNMTSNNQHITNQVTIGENVSQLFGTPGIVIMPNYAPNHNVGGTISSTPPQVQSGMTIPSPETNHILPTMFPDENSTIDAAAPVHNYTLTDLDSTNTIRWEIDNKAELTLLKCKDLVEIFNKENCESLPVARISPNAVKVENENNGSPSVSTNVPRPPLTSSNKQSEISENAKTLKCPECDKLFNKESYLTQHKKYFHSGDKLFKCVQCGKRFETTTSYKKHCSKHEGGKPFQCKHCPKQFHHKRDLRRHTTVHTGEKRFSCTECGKRFIRKDHMLKHSDTHSKNTNKKCVSPSPRHTTPSHMTSDICV